MADSRRVGLVLAALLLVGTGHVLANDSRAILDSDLQATPLGSGTLLLRGPYLQVGTPTSIVIRWRTDALTNSRVVYGKAAEITGGLPQPPAPGSLDLSVDDYLLVTDHELTLTGLSPNTRYYYGVGEFSGESFDLLAGEDEIHFFDTPTPTGVAKPIRVWVLGDSGKANQQARDVRDAYLDYTGDVANGGANARHTELWLMLGDNAYPQGTDAQHQAAVFDMYPEMTRKSVLWPTPGNHDLYDSAEGTWPYFDVFTMPVDGEAGGEPSTNEAYYSFDYANVHFVSVNSATYVAGTLPGSDMMIWLEADLMDTTQDWIVVFFHHPPYSKAGHDSDDPGDSNGRLVEMRTVLVPLLEDHGVDLVLAGHCHSYERSFLIHGHDGDSSTYEASIHAIDEGDGHPDGDGAYQAQGVGAVFTVAGNASHITQGVAEVFGGEKGVPPHPAMYASIWELGSVVLDFDGNRLDVIALSDTGSIQDEYTLIKGAPANPPTASFEADPLNVSTGQTVSFTEMALNSPTLWHWDLDDDGTIDSAQIDPTFSYDEPGLYSVRLTVSNSAGSDELVRPDYICVTNGIPEEITGLVAFPDKTSMAWDPNVNASFFDVLKGDLILLTTGADLAGAVLGCIGQSVGSPFVQDFPPPPSGQGYFYLVRGANCLSQTGSYDTTGPGQAAPRDIALQGVEGCACAPGDDPDRDGYCDAFDNCPNTNSSNLADDDDDGLGDVCDPCPGDSINDPDLDLICGEIDNCPQTSNPDQLDYDEDLLGDACDPDDDNDGVKDEDDLDPFDEFVCSDVDGDTCDDCSSGTVDPFDDGEDIDADGICDLTDLCVDADGDGLGNGSMGNVGCLDPTTDSDDSNDTVCSDVDDDLCDDCAVSTWDPGNDGPDPDSDGICDASDNCPLVVNIDQLDADDDAIGDACDTCTDLDDDGAGDEGFPLNTCPLDNCPSVPNEDQGDLDEDTLGDACDPCTDTDGDTYGNPGFPNPSCSEDNCPDVANDQQDFDADGLGDVCDPCTDGDKDGYGNPGFPNTCDIDNCPNTPNPGQEDFDGDSLGDECDPDDDNDGVHDENDGDPLDPFVCFDLDNDTCDDCSSGTNDAANDGPDPDEDGICTPGDVCPLDPDNDRDLDGECGDTDNCPGHPNPDQTDTDGDGIGDDCRYVVADGPYVSALEVTNAAYIEFLDAVAASDPMQLYSPLMANTVRGGIVRFGNPGDYGYVSKPSMDDKPVNFVSWLDAARYANWLHNGKPSGEQGPETTETGGYDLTGINPGRNAVRSLDAQWFLPTSEEWGTMAYTDPVAQKNWLFPTRADLAPHPSVASATGDVLNPGFNVANHDNAADWNGTDGNVTSVAGAGPLSASHWDTYDQGGNVAEWMEETDGGDDRLMRGGAFNDDSSKLRSSSVEDEHFTTQRDSIGFRVAASTVCSDLDGDGWGVPWTPSCPLGPASDNCPGDWNPLQVDTDHDGVGDACDDDDDGDGIEDSVDCRPLIPGVSQEPEPIGSTLRLAKGATPTLLWLRSFQGHTANVYFAVQLPGADMPTMLDCLEAEIPETDVGSATVTTSGAVVFFTLSARNACGESALALPISVCGTLDQDTDQDEIPDLEDNCPASRNTLQLDDDGDFVGNECDNCVATYNPDQSDQDGDQIGDACDTA